MRLDLSANAGAIVPVAGWVWGLRFDGRVVYLWWGQDSRGEDCFAARSGRLHGFGSEEACRAAAKARGWTAETGDDDDPVTDLEPAQEWLRGKRFVLDLDAALNLWNCATDVAYSTGRSWNDRGRARDQCYDKLFAAAVPWVYGRDSYRPVWSSRQVRVLRETLSQAVRLLRVATQD